MVQTIICRSSQEKADSAQAGSGLGVVFSVHCWPPLLLSVLCIARVVSLDRGIKHRLPGVRLLIARVWIW